MREISERTRKTLRQIRDTKESVIVKREAVEPLLRDGLVDEVDGHLFLTEAGGEALNQTRDV